MKEILYRIQGKNEIPIKIRDICTISIIRFIFWTFISEENEEKNINTILFLILTRRKEEKLGINKYISANRNNYVRLNISGNTIDNVEQRYNHYAN